MDPFFGGDSRSLGNLVFEGARRGDEISSSKKIYYINNVNIKFCGVERGRWASTRPAGASSGHGPVIGLGDQAK